MIYKKYIDKYIVKDLPQNGVITIDIENDNGELVQTHTGVSNLPLAFEKDEVLANRNGYYEYQEDMMPLFDERTQQVTFHYEFDGEKITKRWDVTEIE